jgi:hypothetical protein
MSWVLIWDRLLQGKLLWEQEYQTMLFAPLLTKFAHLAWKVCLHLYPLRLQFLEVANFIWYWSCFSFLSAATMFAAQSIQLGINDIVVAGGMESMSNAPKYIAEARYAYCCVCCG